MKERYRKVHEEFDNKCFFCGRPATSTHHIHPKSRGGSDRPSNLIPVDNDCHRNCDWLVLRYFIEIDRERCRGCQKVGKACFKCPVQNRH